MGYMIKKGKKENSARSLGNMEEKMGGNEVGKQRIGENLSRNRSKERVLYYTSKALSTVIRFQTKTELLSSVFKKICVHTYRFRIVFARPHYKAVSV